MTLLQLSLERGALGLELASAATIGPVEVRKLRARLGALEQPMDLSGGVAAFRHRRGELEHLELAIELGSLRDWVSPLLTRLLEAGRSNLSLWWLDSGIGVGICGEASAFAFDLLWATDEGDLRVIVTNARGAGLGSPALQIALQALSVLFPGAERRGRTAVVRDVARQLSKELWPLFGARVPHVGKMRATAPRRAGDHQVVRFDLDAMPMNVSSRFARARSFAELVKDGDAALADAANETGELGDGLDSARAHYVRALESAPRNRELAQAIAEIDTCSGVRAEAALGLLRETRALLHSGSVGADLLARSGDFETARHVAERAARRERFAPLAAMAWLRLAMLEVRVPHRIEALSRGLGHAPGLKPLRHARFEARLQIGDRAGAEADAQHLEAATRGASARYRVCRAVADQFLEARCVPEATRYFERALRYVPDDAGATAGLGRALLRLGRPARAVVLLERAIELVACTDGVAAPALIDLAEVLAGPLGDRSQAVSRVREIPDDSAEGPRARMLEAGWRASLGDAAGATLAYGRMRARFELNPPTPEMQPRAVDWLLSAVEHAQRNADEHSARAHVALAFTWAPNDPRVARAYGELFPASIPRAKESRQGSRPATVDSALTPAPPSQTRRARDSGEREDAVRAEELQEQLRARPDDDDVASNLADVLNRLGRYMDLFALVCARIDELSEAHQPDELSEAHQPDELGEAHQPDELSEAHQPDQTDAAVRARWLHRLRDVAGELGRSARERGHSDEAELYEATVARFS